MPDQTPLAAQLAELYEHHAGGLLAFLCGRLNDAALAEDVLHDVFIAFHRQTARTQIEAPKAYLYMAAQRLSLNVLRQQRQDARLQERLAPHAFTAASGADPLEAEAARQALAALASDERDVIALRVYAGLNFQEIAAVLQAPLTTVHRRHEAGLTALRRALGAPEKRDSAHD